MRVYLFRVVWPCWGGARTLLSSVPVARQTYRQVDVHSPQSAICVRSFVYSVGLSSLIRAYVVLFSFFLQYSVTGSPLREEKRRYYKTYRGTHESRQGQLKHLIHRPITDLVHFYDGEHP